MATKFSTPTSTNRSFFPISVNVKGRKILVVGGGKTALAEIERILDFGAIVEIVAQHLMAELQELARARGDQIVILAHKFGALEMANLKAGHYLFVIAADHQGQVNAAAIEAATQAGVLSFDTSSVNDSDFTMPAVFKRGHLKISVSTDGISPVLEQAILSNLESALLPELDKDAIFLNSLAEDFARLKAEQSGTESRLQAVYQQLSAAEDLRYALGRRNFAEARTIVQRILTDSQSAEKQPQA